MNGRGRSGRPNPTVACFAAKNLETSNLAPNAFCSSAGDSPTRAESPTHATRTWLNALVHANNNPRRSKRYGSSFAKGSLENTLTSKGPNVVTFDFPISQSSCPRPPLNGLRKWKVP